MATRDVPLPKEQRKVGNRRRSVSGSRVRGWDENIGQKSQPREQQGIEKDDSREGGGPSIATHAIAHGCHVFGTARSFDGGDNDADTPTLTWQTSFDPHNVSRVASNLDGSVIAASTDGGTVSLLRGSDGGVLATRRVSASAEDDRQAPPAHVTFVSRSKHEMSVVGDVLIILSPHPKETSTREVQGDEAEGISEKISAILVSGIDGARLNDTNPATVKECARGMSIDALSLELENEGHIVSLQGCFINDRKIRFLATNLQGILSVHDYDVKQKASFIVKREIEFSDPRNGDVRKLAVDPFLGVRVHNCGLGAFFVVTTILKYSLKVLWFDVNSMCLASEYPVQGSGQLAEHNNRRLKVLALEPVSSCSDESAFALAIALKSSSSAGALIQVVQAVAGTTAISSSLERSQNEEDYNDEATTIQKKTMVLSRPHLVYTIPHDPSLAQSSVESIDIAAEHIDEKTGPYSFRYKVKYACESDELKEFTTPSISNGGETVGKFRLLLAKGLFDEADQLLATAGVSNHGPYASLHSSEVALWRLQRVLTDGNVSSKESMAKAKECLRRLAAGAVSGGEIGVRCLLEASASVSSWPTDPAFRQFSEDGNSSPGPLIREFRMALSVMASTVASATKASHPTHIPILQEEKRKLDSQASAMKCVESVIGTGEKDVYLTYPLTSVMSIEDLFRTLVSHGFFTVAERVRQSEWGRKITSEIMASSILGVSSDVDPRLYTTWLKEVVIPGLSVNHQLLKAIRSWACRTADAFDAGGTGNGDGLGLESSVLLLEAVRDAIAKLQVRAHSSFALSSPFIDDEDATKSEQPPSVIDSFVNESLNSSGDSTLSSEPFSPSSLSKRQAIMADFSFDRQPNPTVLQLGLLRGGARKIGSKSFARRLAPSTAYGTTISDLSLLTERPSNADAVPFHDGDEEEDCVETKLCQAMELNEARSLGLCKDVLALNSYSSKGGSRFIARKLVQAFSSSAVDDADRKTLLLGRVMPFCEFSRVSFDDAVAQHAKQLCDSRSNDPNILREAGSLSRCCCSPQVKCQIALKVLRAALLCKNPPSSYLSSLSRDAIGWVADEETTSELEEATRLLVIDAIVRRYCGNGAQDCFRVSEPRHGLSLLHHVCRHVDEPSVLTDSLALCDAFTHVSRVEACILILERTLLAPEPMARSKTGDTSFSANRADQCGSILHQLFSIDPSLAENTGARTVYFCSETIKDCSNSAKGEKRRLALAASSGACSLLSVMQERSSQTSASPFVDHAEASKLGASSWSNLLREFQRIAELQKNFSVFLTLGELRTGSRHDKIAARLLGPVTNLYLAETKGGHEITLRAVVEKARRGCCLLFGDEHVETTSSWSKAVGVAAGHLAAEANDAACFELLEAAGVLDEIGTESAFRSVVSVAVSLCARASAVLIATNDSHKIEKRQKILDVESAMFRMRCVVRASSLLQEHALIFCPQGLLGSMVALGTLTETVSQVLVRADGGAGEKLEAFRSRLHEQARKRFDHVRNIGLSAPIVSTTSRMPSSPTLHTSWYVGDGLLLPPSDALVFCLAHCNILEGLPISRSCESSSSMFYEEGATNIYTFLGSRGAHSIALRMLTCSTAATLTERKLHSDNETWGNQCFTEYQETLKCLAERSLGGSGNGITSGTIDSQLAVSYLLSLPIKLAFKVYRASLPSAISRRDFARVVTLANIGVRAGTGEAEGASSPTTIKSTSGWRNQSTFVAQCKRLASNAAWWAILQTFQVDFEPRRFDEVVGSSSTEISSKSGTSPKPYVASLVPALISNSSKMLQGPDAVLSLATKFVRGFELDPHLAAQKHVEFLLSWPCDKNQSEKSAELILHETSTTSANMQGSKMSAVDVRHNIDLCERAVKETLRMLPSNVARSSILRRCLISLENVEESGKDYERYSSILSLYRNELSGVVTEHVRKSDSLAFKEELERVERRQDALAVLTSFFQNHRKQFRPQFPRFFLPFPTPFKSDRGKPAKSLCGILGSASAQKRNNSFDPLLALQQFLSTDPSAATATALAPLCHSLGLPQGYVHARSLLERFLRVKSTGSKHPTFEADVRPVLSRLNSARDAAELAEWCAMQYESDEMGRLLCLEAALTHAMKASSEAEQQRRLNAAKDDPAYAVVERCALDTVKRLSSAKSALSDKIKVEAIVGPGTENADLPPQVCTILSKLTDTVQKNALEGEEMTPERFVEGLLTEASVMTAVACLDDAAFFTIGHFRQVATLVHQGCKALADQYSHVNAGKCARVLARRWLVHGDEVLQVDKAMDSLAKSTSRRGESASHVTSDKKQPMIAHAFPEDEDDTANFVMDLNALGACDGVWSDDVGSASNFAGKVDSITTEEEPSALKVKGSAREVSEYANARVALRIAFVISFADGYHRDDGKPEEETGQENMGENCQRVSRTGSKLDKLTRVSRTASKRESGQGDSVMDHARELLRIAFAKSGGASWSSESSTSLGTKRSSTKTPLQRVDSSSISIEGSVRTHARPPPNDKTLTFAMRHRALRTASVLCPQQALKAVIDEEGYFSGGEKQTCCSLTKCTFGSFVASEIESLGLPLPHSDLVQLSTMHFPSYARALWRHHGRSDCRGYKGRLFLLLLEMSLRDGHVADSALVISLLNEISDMELPRTLLNACERMADQRHNGDCLEHFFLSGDGEGGEALSRIVEKAARLVLGEVQRDFSAKSFDVASALVSVKRVGKLVVELRVDVEQHEHIIQFINILVSLASGCDEDKRELAEGLIEVAVSVACTLEGEARGRVFSNLAQLDIGKAILQKRFVLTEASHRGTKRKHHEMATSSALLESVESSFTSDLATAVGNADSPEGA